tara:strand:+ start:5500 stop:6129 length:630 start_codon:yes stop_codon:yes gene_type:complete
MQPVIKELVSIQDSVRESFGWSLESDIESASKLLEACKNPTCNIKLNGKVVVVGAAAPANYITSLPTIVADGAIGALENYSNVVLIVSDGDGMPHLERALNKGIPICLHAHGDNIADWKKVLSLVDPQQEIILTHQTPNAIEGMHNPGGFTDGDRAVCIAFSLGADEVELIGFSTNEVGPWSGVTDEKRKLIKLKWMNKVLRLLSLEAD